MRSILSKPFYFLGRFFWDIANYISPSTLPDSLKVHRDDIEVKELFKYKQRDMAYNNNNTHESIVRQSMLKAAVEYCGNNNITKLTEVVGVGIAFTDYALNGTHETATIVEKKLNQ